MLELIKKHSFLFEELVKRDFKAKYKRTTLGILWSMLYPLATITIMSLVFKNLLGRDAPHFIVYIFCGNLLFAFFKESTAGGMQSLASNAGIISKVNVPKYLFLLSKNISSLVNFSLILVIFFILVFLDGIPFTFKFLLLLYPILCLIGFNIGVGLILSALHVVFKDIQYLYDILTMLLMYLSAIFYSTDTFSPFAQKLFYLNPLYVYITYFRSIVIDNTVPSAIVHFLCLFYSVFFFVIGCVIYKKNNYKFIYYL